MQCVDRSAVMKALALSDIHANLCAPAAVLADKHPVECCLFLGDVVDY